MKQCIRCKQFKINNAFRRDKRQTDGREYYCVICTRELHRVYDRKRDKLESRKASLRRATFNRDYSMTAEQYQNILVSQNYSCAICKVDSNPSGKSFSVDHDHKTGQIRGLLCNACNLGIGHLKDSIEVLEQAVLYLKGVYRVGG